MFHQRHTSFRTSFSASLISAVFLAPLAGCDMTQVAPDDGPTSTNENGNAADTTNDNGAANTNDNTADNTNTNGTDNANDNGTNDTAIPAGKFGLFSFTPLRKPDRTEVISVQPNR